MTSSENLHDIVLDQVFQGTPYFVSSATQMYNLKSSSEHQTALTSTIYRSYDGYDYIDTNGVTSKILTPNQVISHGVVHVIDWPLGVRTGEASCEVESFSSFFYQECLKVRSCVKQLNSTINVSVFVPLGLKSLPQLTSMNMTQKEDFFSFHFAKGFQTRLSLELAFKKRHHMHTGAPNPKRMRVNVRESGAPNFFVDVRPMPTSLNTGYVSSKIFNFARPTETANVFSVSVPFGIYNYTVLDYLKTRQMDLYNSFLMNYRDLNIDLSDNSVFYTIFVPTNLAFKKWMSDTSNNGPAIMKNNETRNWVLRRHFIKGQKLILEDWPRTTSMLYSTLNTQYDEYKLKIAIDDVVIKDNYTIATRASLTISSYVKTTVDIYRGGIQASNGIVYPVDDVLSMSTDINALCISDKGMRKCGQQTVTASILTIFLSLTCCLRVF